MGLANLSIVGNVVRAPEQKQFDSGRIKTTMIVAVNSKRQKKDGSSNSEADYYRVETWGKLAQLAATYINKGNQIAVTGRLALDRWTDDQGRERMTPTMSVDQLALPQKPHLVEVSSSNTASSSPTSTSTSTSASTSASPQIRAATASDDDDGEEDDEVEFDDDSEEEERIPERKRDDCERPVPTRKARGRPRR